MGRYGHKSSASGRYSHGKSCSAVSELLDRFPKTAPATILKESLREKAAQKVHFVPDSVG